ncbi:UDP-N-acetylmuramoyl-L-alanyl-D-glutamate--2,6-diaminopimelate ligase [Nocardioides yefusunii]|uniref:UDP-N-acetylmuramoyl-L-alanyl-D-glutamate--2,6-diaminopimelate ligase n=1 Tax=Nocardioides yefusunii TaxID=2500546 RepID=A0ABW1QY46_9ACTN|nr:UDP-N-acetylmuramoyl-L-alanyl-D-glutamate--2,6-diaminopimelate ligase [Nocardioides yefusunii]
MVDVQKIQATRPVEPPRATLTEVAGWLTAAGETPRVAGAAGTAVSGVTLSTARVLPGDLYAALPGARVHGADYAAAAVDAGAVAVLTDARGAEIVVAARPEVPVLVLDAPRRLLGALAGRLYGRPSQAMAMIGVTGTQGKTTTTQLAAGGLGRAGTTAAVVGTVGTLIDGEAIPTSLTTPEAPDLQALFALMVERGVEVCAMEVSSHALVMGRVDGVVFDVAVFLNLGRDHLDFHTDVEDYYRAKASLFTPERARRALINADDEHGRRLLGETTLPVATFSLHDEEATFRAVDVVCGARGSTFTVLGPDGLRIETSVPLAGDFNVSNALAAIAACALAGQDPVAVAAGIAAGDGVPGRLEDVEAGQDFAVVVDYAHKPDAVEATLRTLRPLTQGQLVVVIGAGGDRDTGKRPLMGEIAARLADVVVVTDDNPRSEEPAQIRAQVLVGAHQAVAAGSGAEVLEVGDRREAIRTAVRRARRGDIVLVAGKGHETGQEVAGVVHPFDDRAVAREELEAL